MHPRCWPSSTTPSWDCLLDKGKPISLMPDAHSLITLIKLSLLWWPKRGRLCNSPDWLPQPSLWCFVPDKDEQLLPYPYTFEKLLLRSFQAPSFCPTI